MTSSLFRAVRAALRGAAGTCAAAGSRKPSVTTCRPSPSALPERRKNGTPAQRQLSSSTRSATNVSVSEPGVDAGLVAVALVLAAHDLCRVRAAACASKTFVLLVPQGLRRRATAGRLHRHEPQELEQVRDDHVPEGAGAFEEVARGPRSPIVSGTSICTWLMWSRFQTGSKRPLANRRARMLSHRLLAEEVVDAEHLGLVEDGVDRRVERPGRREIRAERLLDDDAGVLGEAGRAEHARSTEANAVGRHGEVEQPPRGAADGLLGLAARPPASGSGSSGVGRAEGQRVLELLPRRALGLAPAELGAPPPARARGTPRRSARPGAGAEPTMR